MGIGKVSSLAAASIGKVNSLAKASIDKIYSVAASFEAAGWSNTKSLAFDGSNDYVVVPFTAFDVGTISMWFKGTQINKKVYAKGGGASNFYFRNGSEQTRAMWVQNQANSAQIFDIATISDPLDGNWHFLVVTTDGGSEQVSTMKVYMDGNLEFTNVNEETGRYTTDSSNMMIGATWDGYGTWNGNLDEVGIWDAHVLTAAEITALYNSGEPIDLQTDVGDYGSSGDLTHYYRMGDGDSHPTITDAEGSIDGTMTNMASNDIVTDVPGS